MNTTLFPDMDGFFSFNHKNNLKVFYGNFDIILDHFSRISELCTIT